MAKKFTYRGREIEELQKMSLAQFAELLPSRERRTLKRGFTDTQQKFMDKLNSEKNKIKTHCRELVIVPLMVGKTISIHRGNKYDDVLIMPEMLGLRLGDMAMTRIRGKHSAPGICATKGTSSASVR